MPTGWSWRRASPIRTPTTTRDRWDGAVTPSSWHGVTSVVMGNCGVGIAPCKPEDARDRHEGPGQRRGHPFDVLNKASPGIGRPSPNSWTRRGAQSVAQSRLHRAADAVPPLRHGRGLDGAAATPEETHKIATLIGEAVDARSFRRPRSTSISATRRSPWPAATPAARSCSVPSAAQEARKGAIEIALTRQVGVLEQDQCELLTSC